MVENVQEKDKIEPITKVIFSLNLLILQKLSQQIATLKSYQ